MTGDIECRYYGRDFTVAQMTLLRTLIASPEGYSRRALSRVFCQQIHWVKPDGGLKDMMARCTMLAMHRDGLITLPPRRRAPTRRQPIVFGPETDPPSSPAPTTLDAVQPLTVRIVVSGTAEGQRWNQFIARYHYLGYQTLVGAQMRYTVEDCHGHPLALLGFSTAAWQLAPRDRFIGWTAEQRKKNLPWVIDNPRFLILPWIRLPNLGSHLLAIMKRRLPEDWTTRYRVTPVLIETFVQIPTYTGAVYQASGWTRVGTTQGRVGMIGTTGPTSPKRISGYGPCGGTGNAPSSGKIPLRGVTSPLREPPIPSDLPDPGGRVISDTATPTTPFEMQGN